jgi:alpha-tubulin suppressor-like RCC1 family protein
MARNDPRTREREGTMAGLPAPTTGRRALPLVAVVAVVGWVALVALAPVGPASGSPALGRAQGRAATTVAPSFTPPGAVSLAAGGSTGAESHACEVVQGGTVRCWGANTQGQLGDGTLTDRTVPTPVLGLTGVVAVSTGRAHTCALRTDATVSCWGRGAEGQLGTGTTDPHLTPTAVPGLTGAVAVATGGDHTCAIVAGGAVRCWGWNASGQIGDGTTGTNRLEPTPVPGLTGATGLALGIQHSCALLSGGSVRCWGWNAYGQLGDGTQDGRPSPVAVSGLSGATAIAMGGAHSCALVTGGTVRCWGNNDSGQVGDGSQGNLHLTSVAVPGLSGVTAVSAGGGHSCALLADATARCWGRNGDAELGNGNHGSPVPTPTAVTGLTGAVALAAGAGQTCARQSGGRVLCWGDRAWGVIGNGTRNVNAGWDQTRPTPISTAAAVGAGSGHTCVVTGAGEVRCWGRNTHGQLGDGTQTSRKEAAPVSGIGDAVAVTAAGYHSCALRVDGTVWCWGDNGSGQLGGATTDGFSTVPLQVPGLSNVIEVSGGVFGTCALRADGSVHCWGDIEFEGLTSAVGLSTGWHFACAPLADGTVRCWGANEFGQLGDGTTDPSEGAAVQVSGLTGITSVGAGDSHACAVTETGSVRCWGHSSDGQIGDGTVGTDRLTPVPVSGPGGVGTVDAGYRYTCAASGFGETKVWCWGNDDEGELGDGTAGPDVLSPQLSLATDASSLTTTWRHTCAGAPGGALRCWGDNYWGTVGDGTWTTTRPTPVLANGLGQAAPFATWSALVDRQFRDLVGRAPTTAESSSWVNQLTARTKTPADLVVALRRSAENTTNVDPVARPYRAYFLRVPDKGGLTYWVRVRRTGRTLIRISNTFVASSEFTNRYGSLTNRQFVELVYQNVLGRPGDAGGIAFWTKQLDLHKQSRGQVMLGFSESNEYKRTQTAEVDAAVLWILVGGRQPTAAEYAVDLAALDAGALAATVDRLLTSSAYAARVAAL